MPLFRALPTCCTPRRPAAWLAALACSVAAASAAARLPVDELVVPPGFHVEVLTDAVPSAREMAWSPRGVLYVGTREGRMHSRCRAAASARTT